MYSGKADWDIIKKIKDNVRIPVILNGDIADEKSAEKALRHTGCDALMIGRASIGNPYLFTRINHYFEDGEILEKQSLKERVTDFMEFTKTCKEYGYVNISSIKMQAQNFTKGFFGSSEIRKKISESKSIYDMMKSIEEFLNQSL